MYYRHIVGTLLIWAVGVCLSEAPQGGLWNRQLKVAVHCLDCIPKHFLFVKNQTDGRTRYGGYFGEIMNFIHDARNCSFTFVTPEDKKFGDCSGINNCTGLIGMLNRKEADFGIPGLVSTKKRRPNIDFSAAVLSLFSTIVIPLTAEPNIWYFTSPMTYQVWLCLLFSIPIYFLMMALADYIYCGHVNWESLGAFILQNVLSEHNTKLPEISGAHKKLLIAVWVWMTYVLVLAYASILTAMLASPTLPTRIKNVEDLILQDKIPWVIDKPSFGALSLWKAAWKSKIYKDLYDKATKIELSKNERFKYGCMNTQLYEGRKTAAVCRSDKSLGLISTDFSRTAKCNFYSTTDKFLITKGKIAFQVGLKFSKTLKRFEVNLFQKGSPILDDFNDLIFLAGQMGYKWGKLGTSLSDLANVFADAYPAYRNYTKCDSWEKIVSSHKEAENRRVIKIEDIYGLVLILFTGFVFTFIAILAEKVISTKTKQRTAREVGAQEMSLETGAAQMTRVRDPDDGVQLEVRKGAGLFRGKLYL